MKSCPGHNVSMAAKKSKPALLEEGNNGMWAGNEHPPHFPGSLPQSLSSDKHPPGLSASAAALNVLISHKLLPQKLRGGSVV